jgi:hypothetical protein
MYIKRKTCNIRTWEKLISWHILHQHWHTCPIALPVRRNLQRRSLLTFVFTNSTPLRLSNVLERMSWPSCELLYETNTSHREQVTFLYKYPLHWVPLPTKTHNRTLLFGITLKHGLHFDYWNQPLNMRMRVCYIDCHEAGQCCYLVIHIENLLYPLQLFYLHLWLIYWLSLVYFRIWWLLSVKRLRVGCIQYKYLTFISYRKYLQMFQFYENVTRETCRNFGISKTVKNHIVILWVTTPWVWYVITSFRRNLLLSSSGQIITNNQTTPCHNTDDHSLDSRLYKIYEIYS